MKKISILAVAAVAVLSMTSCKKDRTCTCSETSTSGGTTSAASTTTVVVNKSTKNAANGGNCASYTKTQTISGTTVTDNVTCTLK